MPADPFVSIDQQGVGELVRIGVERGRKVRPKLKVGICGEHGGDPASVAFCHEVKLDYVSCSPFRVPIARLPRAGGLGQGRGQPRALAEDGYTATLARKSSTSSRRLATAASTVCEASRTTSAEARVSVAAPATSPSTATT